MPESTIHFAIFLAPSQCFLNWRDDFRIAIAKSKFEFSFVTFVIIDPIWLITRKIVLEPVETKHVQIFQVAVCNGPNGLLSMIKCHTIPWNSKRPLNKI